MLNKAIEQANRYIGLGTYGNIDKVHDRVWESYKSEKSELLFSLFKNELIIEKEVEYIKSRDEISATIRETPQIKTLIEDNLKEQFKELKWRDYEELRRTLPFNLMDAEEEVREQILNLNRILSLRDSLSASYFLSSKTIDREIFYYDEKKQKTIKFPKGTKVNKILKEFISTKEAYDKITVELSKVFNTNRLKGKLCLSIHPMDYLTVSDNDSGWGTCFSILGDGGGEYKVSTMCLLNCPYTMVAYLKSSTNDYHYGCREEDVWNNKKWRTYVTLSKNLDVYHIGNEYPYGSKELIDGVKDMMSELLGKKFYEENLETSKVVVTAPHNMYNDANSCPFHVMIEEGKTLNSTLFLNICPLGPVCVKCGRIGHDSDSDLCCYECSGRLRCDHCDEMISGEDSFNVTNERGEIEEWCYYCYENESFHCYQCEEDYSLNTQVLTSYGETICRYCAESMHKCAECGNSFMYKELDVNGLCEKCASNEEESENE